MALHIDVFDVDVTVRRPRRAVAGVTTNGESSVGHGTGPNGATAGNGHLSNGSGPSARSTITDRILGRMAAPTQRSTPAAAPEVTAGAPRFIAPPMQAPPPRALPRGVAGAAPSKASAAGFKPMFRRLAPPRREAPTEIELGARLDAAGSGRPLDEATRRQMAGVLGADVGDVRVHADERAAGLASDLGAEAFTLGRDVYFGEGKFDPASSEGRALLAHELTHVLQQKGLPRPRAQGFGSGVGREALEGEAEVVRKAVLASPDSFTSERLSVEKYACTYLPNRAATEAERARLERIAARALTLCDEILSARPDVATLAPAPIQTVELDLALTLAAASDEDAARAWGRHMAEAILKAANAPAGAGQGVQKRDEGADPKVDDPKLSEREKIDVALKSYDADDVDEIENFTPASLDERMTLAHIVVEHHGLILGLDDRRSLRRIWSSFPNPIDVASARLTFWESSVEAYSGLKELQWVVDTQEEFKTDIRSIAVKNLRENKDYLEGEKNKLKRLTEEQKQAYVKAVQGIGREVVGLRKQQELMGDIVIGYKDVHGFLGNRAELRFIPSKPLDPQKGEHDNDEGQGATFKETQAQFDRASDRIAETAKDYVWILGLLKDKDSEARLGTLADIKDPNEALAQMQEELERLYDRAHAAQLQVNIGKVDWYELMPIRDLLLAGGKALSGRQWGLPQKGESFRNWAATDAVAGRQNEEWWKEFGLQAATQAALIAVSLATGGVGPLLVGIVGAAVAVGAPAIQAAAEWGSAQQLTDLSKATVLPGTDLVAQAQIDEKKTAAIGHAIEAFVNAALVAADFIKFRKLGRFRPTDPNITKNILGYETLQSGAQLRYARAIEETGRKVEIGLYQHAKSGEYAIVRGSEAHVGGLGEEWIPIQHFHPNVSAIPGFQAASRLGSTGDLAKLMTQAKALERDLTASVLHIDEKGVEHVFHYTAKKAGDKWVYVIRYELQPGKIVEETFEEAFLKAKIEEHTFKVLRAAAGPSPGAVPVLKPGKGFEMFKEAMKALGEAPPDQRALLAKEFEKQIFQNQRPRGGFEFLEQECTNGTMFKGKAGEALVITPEGKMFRGSVAKEGHFRYLGPGKYPGQGRYEAIYERLEPRG